MMKFYRWVYHTFGEDFGGTPSPPGSTQTLQFGQVERGVPMHVAAMGNDGFQIMLGYPDKWHVFYGSPDARRLAWFILWTVWVRGTWFGLKRVIWYWSLRGICDHALLARIDAEGER
jgi:hypothetical protein